MAKLLFRLNSVPADEADEVRALLDEAEIEFYETTPGLLGLSFAAIWIRDESQYEQAKTKLDNYQLDRVAQAADRYQQRLAHGHKPSLLDGLKQRPVAFIAVLFFIVLLLFLTIRPFFSALGTPKEQVQNQSQSQPQNRTLGSAHTAMPATVTSAGRNAL